jgi:hypothetical protein
MPRMLGDGSPTSPIWGVYMSTTAGAFPIRTFAETPVYQLTGPARDRLIRFPRDDKKGHGNCFIST